MIVAVKDINKNGLICVNSLKMWLQKSILLQAFFDVGLMNIKQHDMMPKLHQSCISVDMWKINPKLLHQISPFIESKIEIW